MFCEAVFRDRGSPQKWGTTAFVCGNVTKGRTRGLFRLLRKNIMAVPLSILCLLKGLFSMFHVRGFGYRCPSGCYNISNNIILMVL